MADYSISLRETHGFDAARELSATPAGRDTREKYLPVLREMEDEERLLL